VGAAGLYHGSTDGRGGSRLSSSPAFPGSRPAPTRPNPAAMRLSSALVACTATLLLAPVPAALASTGAHGPAKHKSRHHRHGGKRVNQHSHSAHLRRKPAPRRAPKPAPKPPKHPVAPTPVVTSVPVVTTPPVVASPPVVTTPPASTTPTPTPPVTTTPTPTPPVTSPTPQPAPAAPAIDCDLFASPTGSDSSGNGTLGSPFASVGKLDSALHPGQTGCLRAGSYGSTSTWVKINANGSSTGQRTMPCNPGENATVRAYVDIEGAST